MAGQLSRGPRESGAATLSLFKSQLLTTLENGKAEVLCLRKMRRQTLHPKCRREPLWGLGKRAGKVLLLGLCWWKKNGVESDFFPIDQFHCDTLSLRLE